MSKDNIQDVQQLLVKLAHIANQIEARSADSLRRIDASTSALNQGVQRLGGGAERFAQQATQAIGERAQTVIAQGASQALEQFNTQLKQCAGQVKWAADAMGEQSRVLTRAQNTLVWKGLIALTIGSLLAAGGSAFVAWKSMREIKQAEFSASILRATRSGTLTVCGQDSALCVRVGRKPRHAGAQNEYLLVEE